MHFEKANCEVQHEWGETPCNISVSWCREDELAKCWVSSITGFNLERINTNEVNRCEWNNLRSQKLNMPLLHGMNSWKAFIKTKENA